MDEIDWIKSSKKALKTLIKVCIVFAILLFILSLAGRITRSDWEYMENDFLILFIIGVPIPVLLLLAYSIIYIIDKVINLEKKVITFDKNYIREIPKSYAPAIASLIYDLKIEVFRDYTATILYLCTKKYINMTKEGNSYTLKLGEETDYSKLGKSEKYVLNVIINKGKFDENQFKQEIIEEAQEKKLITDRIDGSILIRWFLVLVISFILFIIMRKINIILGYIYLTVVPLTLVVYCAVHQEIYSTNTQYIRTKKGKELAITLNSIKNYMKEYTLINEKEIDYLQILEEYIPYAISLDEADVIEKFIKCNDNYRDLIYNRKIDELY